MSRNNKIDIGRILKAHNAIYNYIVDPYGFRIGVVVMMKGPNRDTPRVGWALFDETPCIYRRSRVINTLRDIPVVNDDLDHILESVVEVFKRVPESEKKYLPVSMIRIYDNVINLKKLSIKKPEFAPFYRGDITNRGKADLITLAIRRANTDRDNYFAYTPENPGNNERYDQSEVKWDYNWIPINKPAMGPARNQISQNQVVKNPIYAQTIKRAVREAEYRAWRYFK